MKTPAMTAEEATTFEGYSANNAELLEITANLKGCECRPYIDFFTFNRWKAQGMQVQKGEKATAIPIIVEKQRTDPETGEIETRKYKRTSHVFCRCQVKPTNGQSK